MWLGTDILFPTVFIISLHTTPRIPSIVSNVSIRCRISWLSLIMASTLKSIVCSPMLFPTAVTWFIERRSFANASVFPPLVEIKKSTCRQPNLLRSNVESSSKNSFSNRLRRLWTVVKGIPNFLDKDSDVWSPVGERISLSSILSTREIVGMEVLLCLNRVVTKLSLIGFRARCTNIQIVYHFSL